MNFKKLVSVVCTWGVLDIMKLWRQRVERECKIYMVKPNADLQGVVSEVMYPWFTP